MGVGSNRGAGRVRACVGVTHAPAVPASGAGRQAVLLECCSLVIARGVTYRDMIVRIAPSDVLHPARLVALARTLQASDAW